MAADVTLYGRVDTGLSMSFSNHGDNKANTTQLKSGIYAGSRWGVLAREDLSDELKVIVKLENAFDSSTGVADDNRLFGREASLSLAHDRYGTLAMGRIGTVTGALGSFSTLDFYDAFETGFTDASIPGTWSDLLIVDKSVVYVSPEMKGLTAKFQVSFTNNLANYQPKWTDNDRPWATAFEYRGVPKLFVGLGVAGVDKANDDKEPLLINFAVNYDFGAVKPFFAYQYSKNFEYATAQSFGQVQGLFKKSAYLLGLTAPVGGGVFRAQVQYADGREEVSGDDFSKQVYALGYTYPLSKRTVLYSAVSYAKGSGLLSKHKDNAANENRTVVEFGIDHRF